MLWLSLSFLYRMFFFHMPKRKIDCTRHAVVLFIISTHSNENSCPTNHLIYTRLQSGYTSHSPIKFWFVFFEKNRHELIASFTVDIFFDMPFHLVDVLAVDCCCWLHVCLSFHFIKFHSTNSETKTTHS